MPSNKPWLRLADIADNATKIIAYTDGMTYEDFKTNSLVSDATERCMSRISEAAIKLGGFAEELLPAHDWQSIRGIGNILRHDYDGILLARLWDTVEKSIKPLLADVQDAIADHEAAER